MKFLSVAIIALLSESINAKSLIQEALADEQAAMKSGMHDDELVSISSLNKVKQEMNVKNKQKAERAE